MKKKEDRPAWRISCLLHMTFGLEFTVDPLCVKFALAECPV